MQIIDTRQVILDLSDEMDVIAFQTEVTEEYAVEKLIKYVIGLKYPIYQILSIAKFDDYKYDVTVMTAEEYKVDVNFVLFQE